MTKINVRREVDRIIEHDAAIKKGLACGVISIRALARYIQKKLSQKRMSPISLDAIISAIRRYPIKEGLKKFKKPEKLMKNCKLSMKNKIVDIALVNDTEVHETIGRIAPLINFNRGEILRIIVAVQSVKVIADESNLDKILENFNEEKIVKITKNLSEIIITFPKEAERTPGIVSRVSTELAMNDINMIEIISAAPELIVIMDERDALKTYECLSKFLLRV